jgi:hypothetical protein
MQRKQSYLVTSYMEKMVKSHFPVHGHRILTKNPATKIPVNNCNKENGHLG